MGVLAIFNSSSGKLYFAYDFRGRKFIDDREKMALFSIIQRYVKDACGWERKSVEVDSWKIIYLTMDKYGIVVKIKRDEDEETARLFCEEALRAFKEIYEPILNKVDVSSQEIFSGFEYIISKILNEIQSRRNLALTTDLRANLDLNKEDICVGDRFVLTITVLRESEVPVDIIEVRNTIPTNISEVIECYPSAQVRGRDIYFDPPISLSSIPLCIISITLRGTRVGEDRVLPQIIYRSGNQVKPPVYPGTMSIRVKQCYS